MEAPLLVQDVAAQKCNDVPTRYVLRENDRPAVTPADPAPVPVIDLGHLSQPNGGSNEAAKLSSALESWGVFLVANHGIEASLMDELMKVWREFFLQPMEEKQKCSNLVDGKHFRLEGYGNDQVLSEDQVLDWNDRLHLKLEPEDERDLAVWPKHPTSFSDVLNEYTAKSKSLMVKILRAMANIVELKEDYFVNQLFSDKGTTHATFNHYPACPRPDVVLGLKPHSDGGVLTLLLVDKDVGGLQVLKDGAWYDVPIVPDTLLINVGDLMEIMSNGIFKSPVHRVVTNTEKERLSVAMFYAMDFEKDVEPAAELVQENQPALYKKMKTKDYVAGLFEHFSHGTRFIDTIKI